MSDYYIGQIFENEYSPEVASFCSKNNCKIEVTGTVERTVQSHTLEGKQAYAVFADGTKIKLWPYNKQKYAVGQTVAMEQYKIVEIPEPTQDEKDLEEAKQEEQELQSFLNSTDYVAAKLAEGAATKEEYADVLQQRAEARDRINVLRASQESLTAKIAETKA